MMIYSILDHLHIKHTRAFVREMELNNLQHGNLFGLLRLLSVFGVESHAGRLEGVEDFKTVEVPFIAQKNDNFVLVTQCGEEVTYLDGKQERTVPLETFGRGASMIVAEVKAKEGAIEPGYAKHRQQEVWRQLLRWSPLPMVCILGVRAMQMGASLSLLAIAALGLTLSVLLHRQWLGESDIVQKACGKIHSGAKKVKGLSRLLHTSECSATHDTFFFNRWFDLSEVGIAYFGAVLVSLLLFPTFTSTVSLLTFLALPFTAWSLGYQFLKQKKWCPFCVAVQLLVWVMAIVCVCQDLWIIDRQHLPLLHFILLVSLFFSLLAVYVLVVTPGVKNRKKADDVRIQHSSLKGNDAVVKALWGISFASKKHRLRMVLSPTCPYCESDLKTLEELILPLGRYELEKIYFDVHPGDLDKIAEIVGKDEAERQINWCHEHGIKSTPTFFVDEVKMPKEYRVMDLIYL